jgi:predicted dinucleotide-binding enzyme
VVKAFNTIRPASLASLGKPAGAAGRAVIPVAGDDPVAESVVLELRDQLGFDSLDVGPLADSWRQQPGAHCKLSHIQRQGLCWWTAHDAHAGMPRLRR